MLNIKQKFLNFIISFACLAFCLAFISSCSQVEDFSSKQNTASTPVIDVAILLPLSGPDSALSKEYAQMVKIGLSEGAQTKIQVTSYDSSNPQALDKSLEKIIAADTKIIIGPIYSETTDIVANRVKNTDITVLSLSNNPVLADKQVFVYGHAPMRQLEQITNHFLSNNYKNYIALIPSGRHSNLVSTILNDMIANAGATMSRIEFYEDSPESIAKSVQAVSENVDNLNENDFNLTQPVILLADDSETLRLLYNNAHRYNLDKKAILAGDNRTDINFLPPIDITFTGSMNITNKNLLERTKKARIHHISFMHAIAYDAGKMVSQYIGTTYNKTEFLNKMNSSEPFIGISGDIHFIDSIAQRKYEIITKEKGEYKKKNNNDKFENEETALEENDSLNENNEKPDLTNSSTHSE